MTKDLMKQLREKVGEVDNVKSAAQQLEEQVKNVPDVSTLDKKLAAARAIGWDDRGN